IPGNASERTREEVANGFLGRRVEDARAGSGEVIVLNHRLVPLTERGPLRLVAIPRKPADLFLVEHEQRLVAQLRELGAPPRAAAHGEIGLDHADHINLLAVVDLIPDAL